MNDPLQETLTRLEAEITEIRELRLNKPTDLLEDAIKRIKELQRLVDTDVEWEPVVYDDITIHSNGVEINGLRIVLTGLECRMIVLLRIKAGQVATYRALYDTMKLKSNFQAGTGQFGYMTNVRSAMKRLRAKIRVNIPEWDQINVLAGVGYFWNIPGAIDLSAPEVEKLIRERQAYNDQFPRIPRKYSRRSKKPIPETADVSP